MQANCYSNILKTTLFQLERNRWIQKQHFVLLHCRKNHCITESVSVITQCIISYNESCLLTGETSILSRTKTQGKCSSSANIFTRVPSPTKVTAEWQMAVFAIRLEFLWLHLNNVYKQIHIDSNYKYKTDRQTPQQL